MQTAFDIYCAILFWAMQVTGNFVYGLALVHLGIMCIIMIPFMFMRADDHYPRYPANRPYR